MQASTQKGKKKRGEKSCSAAKKPNFAMEMSSLHATSETKTRHCAFRENPRSSDARLCLRKNQGLDA
jgi:hypothetical protein